MADKILDGKGLPIVVSLGTETNLIGVPEIMAPQGEIGASTDTGYLFFRTADNGAFRKIIEPALMITHNDNVIVHNDEVVWRH